MRPRSPIPTAALVLLAACAPRATETPDYPEHTFAFRIVEGADWFDYPVGPPHGRGYYIARHFGEERHRGEDWNGIGGGNTDLGDTVHAIYDGDVVFAGNGDRDGFEGWGNVIIVRHRVQRSLWVFDDEIESMYGHLRNVLVRPGTRVHKGQPIGTIGTARGRFPAHLHFEIRDRVGLGIQSGYGSLDGWVDPTNWIRDHRLRFDH